MVWTAQPVLDGNMAGSQIDQAARNKERRNAARALVAQRVAGLDNTFDTADAGTDENTGTDLIFVAFRMPVGIVQRLIGSADSINDERINLALFLGLHMEVGVEGAIGAIANRNAAGYLAGQIVNFKFRDAASTAFTGNKTLPGLFDTAGKRRHQTKTGDDDTPHIHPLKLCYVTNTAPQALTGRTYVRA